MRLFLALLPDHRTKAKLYPLVGKFKDHALSGNFTSIDNLHLTIVFIGEVGDSERDKLIRVVDHVSFEPFVVKTRQIGFFANQGANDTMVLHLELSKELELLSQTVQNACTQEGFLFDRRPYRPHFTIGRRIRLSDSFKRQPNSLAVPTIFMKCDRLSLMESLRIDGQLVYREIFGKTMSEPQNRNT
jgi:2'-5' RNA ligase